MIAAGGTGGHVYPALAIAEALLAHRPDVRLTFVGGTDDFARPLVDAAHLPFEHIDQVRSGPLHGVPLTRQIVSVVQLALGTLQAIRLIRQRKPSALLLTGGWVGLPAALAARMLGLPRLMYLPDIEPGLTIKVLRPLVNRVAVTAAESAPFFEANKMIVTGYPIRQRMLEQAQKDGRAEGMKFFGLDPSRRTLLVWGGSRGARTINTALMSMLPDLLTLPIQVIHVTGTLDWEVLVEHKMMLERQYPDRMMHYHAYPYLHDEMGLAFACADLEVCRSGASVLGEVPLFKLPAVLVPYPFAWRYQKVNADYLAGHGAAILMPDETMDTHLLSTIRELLLEHPEKLEAMRSAAGAITQEADEGAWNVAQELVRLSGERA
ncbi:MAG: UDP-N-acetylglucosamine--N-acetylmuramyl-(pentapeptide) pyrophosphoryl-undecaprenol N-acetylglucosamine transferase [Anaerolineae bacterium]